MSSFVAAVAANSSGVRFPNWERLHPGAGFVRLLDLRALCSLVADALACRGRWLLVLVCGVTSCGFLFPGRVSACLQFSGSCACAFVVWSLAALSLGVLVGESGRRLMWL